jgi:hypothetical protein
MIVVLSESLGDRGARGHGDTELLLQVRKHGGEAE